MDSEHTKNIRPEDCYVYWNARESSDRQLSQVRIIIDLWNEHGEDLIKYAYGMPDRSSDYREFLREFAGMFEALFNREVDKSTRNFYFNTGTFDTINIQSGITKLMLDLYPPKKILELATDNETDIVSAEPKAEEARKVTFEDPKRFIKNILSEHELSYAELARRIGSKAAHIRDVANGRENPTCKDIVMLCGLFGRNLAKWREDCPALEQAINKDMRGRSETFDEMTARICDEQGFTV